MIRRSFLHGLATLPLIGGSVAILGQPTRVAKVATDEQMARYLAFVTEEMMTALKYLHTRPGIGQTGYPIQDAFDRYKDGLPRKEDIFQRAPLVLSTFEEVGR
jgi:hypothetical protein